MAVSSLSFMLLDVVKTLLIRNWSFELTAKLWPSSQNKEKLRLRQERASLHERVDINITKVRRAIVLSSALSAFKSGVKLVKNVSKSFLNISGEGTQSKSRRASVDMSAKLDNASNSKNDSVTVVNVQKSVTLAESNEANNDLETPTSESSQ